MLKKPSTSFKPSGKLEITREWRHVSLFLCGACALVGSTLLGAGGRGGRSSRKQKAESRWEANQTAYQYVAGLPLTVSADLKSSIMPSHSIRLPLAPASASIETSTTEQDERLNPILGAVSASRLSFLFH